MNQKRISQVLIAAGALAAVGILALAGVYAPIAAQGILESCAEVPGIRGMYWMGLIGVWTVTALFLLALAEYFRISARIGKERSFCAENVKGLRRISLYLGVCAVLWLGAIFAPGILFHFSIGPACILFLLLAMANAALAMLALGLGKLLARAVDIQQENDLTV